MKVRWLTLVLVVMVSLVAATLVTVTRLVEPAGGPWIRLAWR